MVATAALIQKNTSSEKQVVRSTLFLQTETEGCCKILKPTAESVLSSEILNKKQLNIAGITSIESNQVRYESQSNSYKKTGYLTKRYR